MKRQTSLLLINSAIAGGISFCSGIIATGGNITEPMLIMTFASSLLVFFTKLKDYGKKKKSKKGMKGGLFEFI